MKQFLAFVEKEFYHIFRDRRTMMILLAMPIVLIILFGFAITTEVKNVRMGVYAPSYDNTVRGIIDRFDGNPYFEIVGVVSEPGDVEELFRDGKADAALVFGNDFQNRLVTGGASVQLAIDGSEPNIAATIYSYASTVLQQYGSEQASLSSAGPAGYVVIPNVKLLFNPQMKSAYNFVPGVMGLILMLICAMMTSISIVREKERGTMEVLLVSPMKHMGIILAKVVPYLCISTVNVITILLLSVFVLGVPLAGSIFWVGILSLVYTFVALALGMMISSLVNNQVAAMLATGMGLMMPTMVLSGMVFPIENMPDILQWVSCAIPARWYIAGIKKMMIEGLPVRYALKELAILSLTGAALITASLKLFKNRLE